VGAVAALLQRGIGAPQGDRVGEGLQQLVVAGAVFVRAGEQHVHDLQLRLRTDLLRRDAGACGQARATAA
jgi:hypothetical protein